MAVPSNITHDLITQGVDLNPEDQVYRTESGMVVKVKAFHDEEASAPGNEIYRVTGSECGEDGKAIIREGKAAVHNFGRHLVVQSGSTVSLVTALEIERLAAVADTERAAEHYSERKATGVGSLREFRERRAAST